MQGLRLRKLRVHILRVRKIALLGFHTNEPRGIPLIIITDYIVWWEYNYQSVVNLIN